MQSLLWQPWAGPYTPATHDQERNLVRALRRASTGHLMPERVTRDDVTLVMDALRCGLTYEQLRDFVAGLSPARLYAAYNVLDRARLRSVKGWTALLENPHSRAHRHHVKVATKLLPVPVAYIAAAAAANPADTSSVQRLIERTRDRVRHVCDEALAVETELKTAPDTAPAERLALGLRLYYPSHDSLWEHPFFLPPRVGTLSSARVADLLGEAYAPDPGV